jgi:hypothetical protein
MCLDTQQAVFNSYDYVTDMDAVVAVRELVVNQAGGVAVPSSFSHLQRRLESCAPFLGCYANNYPWSRINLWWDGHVDVSGASH